MSGAERGNSTVACKVLLLNYEFPPLGGGAANATACLIDEFAKDRTLRLDLVTSSVGRARTGRPYDNVTIHYLDIGKRGDLHYQTNTDLLRYSAKAFVAAKRLVQKGHYDVCHAFFGIPCGYLARRLRLPYVVSLRGSDVPFYNERFKHLDRVVFRRLSRRIWHDAARVVANSEGLRALALQTAPQQRIDIIVNGVDTSRFFPKDAGNSDPLRVLCVSRLIERKGIEYLIRAVATIPDALLTIVGTGNQETALRELADRLRIGKRVDFAGYVPREETASYYQRAHVFVLPSTNEGMSNTVLEALASGLPVIVTDTGGTGELVEDGRNGFVVPMRSSEAIAEKVRVYKERPDLLRSHGARSREVAESMSWSEVAAAYRRLYDEVRSGHARDSQVRAGHGPFGGGEH